MFSKLVKHCWGALGLLLMMAFFWRFQGRTALMLMIIASLLHEMGHLLALWMSGGTVSFFAASSEGLQIHTDSLRLSYFQEMAAVLAGPAANITAGCLLGSMRPDLMSLAGANWVLGLFNLLPAAPLDGWRFLQLFLCWLLGPVSGTRVAAFCGGYCAVFLSVLLLLLMLHSGGNLWLLPTAAAVAAAGVRVLQKEL